MSTFSLSPFFLLSFWSSCLQDARPTESAAAQTVTFEKDETGLLPKIDHKSWMQQVFYYSTAFVVEENPTLFIPVATGFDYPFGPKTYYSQRNDGDGWYNRQDFRVNNHMGEDWNKEGGASGDCGEPVLAVADGLVVYSAPADRSWGM